MGPRRKLICSCGRKFTTNSSYGKRHDCYVCKPKKKKTKKPKSFRQKKWKTGFDNIDTRLSQAGVTLSTGRSTPESEDDCRSSSPPVCESVSKENQ